MYTPSWGDEGGCRRDQFLRVQVDHCSSYPHSHSDCLNIMIEQQSANLTSSPRQRLMALPPDVWHHGYSLLLLHCLRRGRNRYSQCAVNLVVLPTCKFPWDRKYVSLLTGPSSVNFLFAWAAFHSIGMSTQLTIIVYVPNPVWSLLMAGLCFDTPRSNPDHLNLITTFIYALIFCSVVNQFCPSACY